MTTIKDNKLNIVFYPNDILRKKSQNISMNEIKSKEMQELIKNMIKTMEAGDGVGLAAPQIGKNINLLIIKDGNNPEIFINPIIIKKSRKKISLEEGCLSIPKVYGIVVRPETIWVNYRDIQGKMKFKKISQFASRILQHEIDHLRGVLFIDKAEKITSGASLLKLYENKNQ